MRRCRVRMMIIMVLIMAILILRRRVRRWMLREPSAHNPILRHAHLDGMIVRSDTACIEQLRMDRHTFNVLCSFIREVGGLRDTKNMVVEEMVAIFLHILAFEEKNREIKYDFQRSGEIVSRHFHDVLRAVLKLSRILFKKPEPIPKDCALDGTLVDVNVPAIDKSRHRSRKNTISTNVLGACAPDLRFIYVLVSWEGSAADGRVLRSALDRNNGLKVPRGKMSIDPMEAELVDHIDGEAYDENEDVGDFIQPFEILLEMQNSNWKCDTGYKIGYQSHIEKKMLERFPYCVLKGKPHIESKIKILKRKLGYILEIQKQASGSGFGWDDELKMITGEKEIFMGWAEKLCKIYAKDRASRSMAKGPEDGVAGDKDEGSKIDDDATNSSTQTGGAHSATRGDHKRRRDMENEELGGLSKALISLIDVEKEYASVMSDLKKSFMHDVEIGNKRTTLYEVLIKFEGLCFNEVLEATIAIGLDDKKVELFFSMPGEFKVEIVKSQLK
ncbi:Protein ALP1-like [Bienertia sinuspersici]